MKLEFFSRILAGAVLIATIPGCGGGGGSSSGAFGSLSGTAATGAALANANVAITNSSGNSPCQEASITTSALGSYTCTLKSGETAPFFVVVTDPTGNTQPLVSVATTTPAAGAALTVNATPLTTAILSQLASDGNALTLVGTRNINATTLAAVTANVVAQLQPILQSINAPAGYDPFATSITAATASSTGNTADMLLDVVKVTTTTVGANQVLALTTASSTTPIVMATATSSGSTVPLPSYSVSDLSQAAQATAQNLQSCFALPAAQRALATNPNVAAALGGATVTSMAATCQNLFATAGGPAAIDYLNNGYSAGQQFYNLLTGSNMDNAKFSVSEIMAYYPASGSVTYDQAVLNTRYVDGNGNAGNIITNARNIPNSSSSAHPSTWWLVGNQHTVDIKVKLQIRRVEQLNPAVGQNTNQSATFQSGIQFNINATGPGSVDGNSNPLSFARVTGAGLPSGGLVLIAPDQAHMSQQVMDMYTKNGSLSGGTRCGNGAFNCPNFWFSRTLGITGSDATTLGTNPTNLVWAQPGEAIPANVKKGEVYTIELFYGSSTTASVTIKKTLLSDLILAERAVNLPWNTAGTRTLAALDPAGSQAGAQSNLTVDWVQNPSAQQIGGAQGVIDSSGSYGPMIQVPSGATSINLTSANTLPAFSTNSLRVILFSYRLLDDSGKSSIYRYN